MADVTLAPAWAPIRASRPAVLDRLAGRAEILRRRARRNRYLALTGRSPQPYPWFAAMVQSMSGR